MTRSDTPAAWDERSTLLAMLDFTRQTAWDKCSGLAPAHVGVAPLVTSPLTTVGGVLNHMRWVEHAWIEHRFVGGPDLAPWTDEDPDREFRLGAVQPLEETLRGYAEQAARTDAVIAGLDLDERSLTPLRATGELPTLRWVVLHLIEENARHNGHLDLIREQLDGSRGD
jgi:uncharacterized damage-inducible protein DinB